MSYTVVIPTIGRPSLDLLLAQLVSGAASDHSSTTHQRSS